ncbi:MAG: GNAT family N-acetyltransferase [Ruminiclostridium sp.]|nr:GNAT family N-acetyltransferase [Ruminiclostridium sp.]
MVLFRSIIAGIVKGVIQEPGPVGVPVVLGQVDRFAAAVVQPVVAVALYVVGPLVVGLVLDAVAEDKVVGALLFQYRHVGSDKQVARDVLFIDAMAVDESFRGKGIGHMLFDAVKKIAKEKQLDGIELQVNARNIRAKAMYESYGFTEKSINMELL